MASDNVKFDPKALCFQLEGVVVKRLLAVSGMDDENRANVDKMIAIFGKHGIGALEAITITAEIAAALNKPTE